MPATIISPENIIKAAGTKRYEQAIEALGSSKIKDFQGNESSASATIESYNVKIRYLGENVEGSCNCEDSDGFEFCIHCVQLTLHANKMAQQLLSLSKGPDKSKVFAYLASLDKQDLAKQFLDIIEQDTELFQRYILKASMLGDSIDFNALKSEITTLTRIKEKLFSQRQVKHFFNRIERFYDEIDEIKDADDPDKMTKLIEYSYSRLNKLLDKLDDRANQRSELINRLRESYLYQLKKLPTKASTTAKRLYKIWEKDNHQLIVDFPEFLEDLGDEIQEEFQCHAKACWQKDQLASKQASQDTISSAKTKRLGRFLLHQATKHGQFDEEQNLRIALADRESDWLIIAQRWQEKGHLESALKVLSERVHQAPTNKEAMQQLTRLLANHDEKLEHLIGLFKLNPLVVANALFLAAKENNCLPSVQSQCIAILEQRENDEEFDLFIQLLMSQNEYLRAIAFANTHKINIEVLVELAYHVAKHDSQRAIPLLQKCIKLLLRKQLSKSDRQAAELLLVLKNIQNDYQSLNQFLESLRPLLQTRPNFLSTFQTLSNEQNR